MNMVMVCFCILFSSVFVCKAFPIYAQPMEMDRDERLSVDQPFVEESKAEMEAEKAQGRQKKDLSIRESREIKYVAGPDTQWFTHDDEVYEYFLLHYDNKGRLSRRSGFLEGPDSALMTQDDVLHEYLVYEYGAEGRISREILYNGQGILQYTGVYEYDSDGLKKAVKRYDGNNKEISSTNYFHGHAGLIIRDVEYKRDEIEKYHVFKYDNKHNAGKVTEFLGAEGGKGKDGVWFTDDDMITSTKLCYYNPDNTKDKEKKYIKPGPDKKWFTKDDVMQYYTLFYYQ